MLSKSTQLISTCSTVKMGGWMDGGKSGLVSDWRCC